MSKKLLFLLVLLLAAGEAPRTQLRYHPASGSTWLTEGRLQARSVMGTDAATEVTELAWQDVVGPADASGTVALVRTVTRWQSGPSNPLPEPMRYQMSKLAEQSHGGLLDQPALYPLRTVAVGESWPIEQSVSSPVPIGGRVLRLTTVTRGTGTLASLDPQKATLQLALTVESSGQEGPVATKAVSQVQWTLKVERAEGVPVAQKMVTTTDQTVTLGDVVVPCHSETTLELTTRRAP